MTRESFYRDLGVYSVRGLFMSSVVTSVDFFFFFLALLGIGVGINLSRKKLGPLQQLLYCCRWVS